MSGFNILISQPAFLFSIETNNQRVSLIQLFALIELIEGHYSWTLFRRKIFASTSSKTEDGSVTPTQFINSLHLKSTLPSTVK